MAPSDSEKKQPPKGEQLHLDRRKFTLRFRMTLPSTRTAINHAVEQVMQIACECLQCEQGEPDLEISLREALANAVIHGNESEPGKNVSLRCYGDPDRGIIVAIRDQGTGFDPETVPDPRASDKVYLHHGRGLFLMRELMDHVEHRKGGREVVIHRTRKQRHREED